MGKIRPNKGSILIDDKEIETLNRALYYSHLAVVSYNTYLLMNRFVIILDWLSQQLKMKK